VIRRGEGEGGGEARGTASFHCLRSGARAPPPTHPGHTIRYPWPLYIPARRLTRGLFFFFFFLFFFSTAGPPTFIIDALGPLRGQIEAKARTGRPVFASQRGLGLLLLLLLLPPHASMRTIGSEGAESDTTGPPLTTSRLSQAPAGLQGGRSAD